jgi:hypothetical protein
MMKPFFFGLATLTLLVNGLGQANADIIYNNFGPSGSYETDLAWTVSGTTSAFGAVTSAMEFTASLTAAVAEVDLAVGLSSGTNSVVVSLMTDNGGTPGLLLESYSFVNQMGTFTDNNPPLVGISVTHPLLMAGTNYWLVVAPGATDTNADWNQTTQDVRGTLAQSTDGGATWSSFGSEPLGAFEVFGDPVAVPEPSTLVMSSILFGIGGVGLVYRRFKKTATAV